MDEGSPACVLVFNASDPSGAGGLTADISHHRLGGRAPALPWSQAPTHATQPRSSITSAWTTRPWPSRPARWLEDLPVQAIKVGFVGSAENISAIAEIVSDYDEVPVIAYMPDLSWWQED
jgi:hydroxymethylpyrimidine/phosphomethylpyrimidine kinase